MPLARLCSTPPSSRSVSACDVRRLGGGDKVCKGHSKRLIQARARHRTHLLNELVAVNRRRQRARHEVENVWTSRQLADVRDVLCLRSVCTTYEWVVHVYMCSLNKSYGLVPTYRECHVASLFRRSSHGIGQQHRLEVTVAGRAAAGERAIDTRNGYAVTGLDGVDEVALKHDCQAKRRAFMNRRGGEDRYTRTQRMATDLHVNVQRARELPQRCCLRHLLNSQRL